jgi:hypothetical protein
MFLTRSKTSSAISEEQYRFKGNDNMLPLIPYDMIPVLEKASPSIDSALNSVLPQEAKDLSMNMISAWIVASRIAANNKLVSKASPKLPSKPSILRSWTSRSFLAKPKTSVVPLQTRSAQISEKPTINHDLSVQQERTPSLTGSSTFTASSLSTHEEEDSLHTASLQDADQGRSPPSRLPVSLKSMIDLLDTPPLIPDQSNLSLIEETLTPMTSSFLAGHGHTINSPCLEEDASQFAATSENINAASTAPSTNPKSMRNSISSMISNLGLSMKKAFKMKTSQSSSIVQLKKSLSIQRHLSTSKGHRQAEISRVSTVSSEYIILYVSFVAHGSE